ncbi:MAG: hypothetical protein ACJAZN_000308 [Planctomycetota bacterium]
MQIILSFAAAMALFATPAPDTAPPNSPAQASASVELAGNPIGAPVGDFACTADSGGAARPDDGRGTPYVVTKTNNICGLDEPRQLTNPAVVDYDALLEATPERKKMKKDKIDPTSSEGITLMTKARARVLKACESVRASHGHCSVWKVIKRRDKRAVDDITDEVKRQL